MAAVPTMNETAPRKVREQRSTNETSVLCELDLDGTGSTKVATGVGFLDHLIDALGKHAGFDLVLEVQGDLEVDDHHTVEDAAIVLGRALRRALGERRGIARFGSAFAPLDEALARAVVDLSGRGSGIVDLALERDAIGALACENVGHFVRSLAVEARAAIHLDVLRGENDHHRAEAAFKALALALKQAVRRTGSSDVPSTKAVLDGDVP